MYFWFASPNFNPLLPGCYTFAYYHCFLNICNCTSPRPCFSLAYNYHQMFSTVFYVILLIYILLYNLFILHAHFTCLLSLSLIIAFVIYFSRFILVIIVVFIMPYISSIYSHCCLLFTVL